MALAVILILIGLAAVAYYLLERPERRNFWRLAARHPDNAYDWFVSHEGWIVVDPDYPLSDAPKGSQYTDPFVLWVPKLGGRRVLIYGKRDVIAESQEAFIRVFGPYGD